MSCHHCHNPGIVIRLLRVSWPTVKWMLIFKCLNPCCTFDFVPMWKRDAVRGQPTWGIPL